MTGSTETAYAMVLEGPGGPLRRRARPVPVPGAGQVLIRVAACGVCRTDLHLLDGELPDIRYPIVPGHQVVGHVAAMGPDTARSPLQLGQRVGLPWLGHSCGHCDYCRDEHENLCDQARFTGYQLDGGYATHCLADAGFVLPLDSPDEDAAVAPLLCAGLIGYRALRFCKRARRLGLYGFGASAHLVAQVARWEGRAVYAFTRRGDTEAQQLARTLGACWAGAADEHPPELLDAAIIFAAAGELVPAALAAVRKGGRVVCAGIHMSDIPGFPYAALWGERSIGSVANLTRRDGREFLAIAPLVPVRAQHRVYPLEQANEALADLRAGRLSGAAVLTVPAS